MLDWLLSNLSSIIVVIILMVIVCVIIRKLIRDKKAGKSTCGCGCGGCTMNDTCHKKNEQ